MRLVCHYGNQGRNVRHKNEAIQAGEELVYDLKFNWKFIWVAAGQAKMDMQAITYQGKPCFRSNLISVSNRQVDFFF